MTKSRDNFVISNAETFNKYLLAISSSAFPALWYLIDHQKGFILGFKIALAMFGVSLILNMFTLALVIDDPHPKACKNILILFIDWFIFVIFSSAIALSYISFLI